MIKEGEFDILHSMQEMPLNCHTNCPIKMRMWYQHTPPSTSTVSTCILSVGNNTRRRRRSALTSVQLRIGEIRFGQPPVSQVPKSPHSTNDYPKHPKHRPSSTRSEEFAIAHCGSRPIMVSLDGPTAHRQRRGTHIDSRRTF